MARSSRLGWSVLGVVLAASGCGSLDVTLSGGIEAPLVDAVCGTPEHPVVLSFSSGGRLAGSRSQSFTDPPLPRSQVNAGKITLTTSKATSSEAITTASAHAS